MTNLNAGFNDDGKPHVEFVTQRAFTEWVPEFLANGLAFKPPLYYAGARRAIVANPFIEQAGTPICSITLITGSSMTG